MVASESEAKKYRASLGDESPTILVAQKGVVKARRFVLSHFPAGTHVVSLDDDIKDVSVKSTVSGTRSQSLPVGGFQALVQHAFEMMRVQKSFVWALNVSQDERKWYQHISRKAGLINGHFYGFISRPGPRDLLPKFGEAAEDVERSIRLFLSDGIVLRYMMYHAKTRPYAHEGGLTGQFSSRFERKVAEIEHCKRLVKEFPAMVSLSPSKHISTLCIQWAPLGLPPLKNHGDMWVASTAKMSRKKPSSPATKRERA